ncbi:tetratricopeptide repeat protein, partial [Kitasatospora sp. NPDC001574]
PPAYVLAPARPAPHPAPPPRPAPRPAAALPETTVDDALTHAHDALGASHPAAARLYRVLGTLPLPGIRIDTAMAAAAAALDPDTCRRLLATLTDRRLITPDNPEQLDGRFVFAAADGRRHAARLATLTDGPTAAHTFLARALDWLTAQAHDAARQLAPHRRDLPPELLHLPTHHPHIHTPDQARTFFATHDDVLLTALHTARDARLDAHTAFLAHAYFPHLLRRRDYQVWVTALDLAVTAAYRLTSQAPRAGSGRALLRELLGSRATALRALGRHNGAIADCRIAHTMAIEDRDQADEARALHDLAACYRGCGRPDDARPHLQNAHAMRQALGRARDAAVTLTALAETVADLGERSTALDYLQTARRALLAEGDQLNAARALALTGHLLTADGHPDDARDALRQALAEFEAEHAVLWQARVLNWNALAAEAQHRNHEAIDLHRRALALYVGSPLDAARVRADLERLGAAT